MKKILESFSLEAAPFKLHFQRMNFGWEIRLLDSESGDVFLHSDTEKACRNHFCHIGDSNPDPVIREMVTRCVGLEWRRAADFLREAAVCLREGFHV